jgi:hypothetical protein
MRLKLKSLFTLSWNQNQVRFVPSRRIVEEDGHGKNKTAKEYTESQ